MRTEAADLSTAYLMGWKTIRDFAEWLAGIDWNNADLDTELSNALGTFELLSTEVLEGLRPETEFWQEVARFVARETGSVYGQQAPESGLIVSGSSNDSTVYLPEFIVQAAGESRPWSISPLPEPV